LGWGRRWDNAKEARQYSSKVQQRRRNSVQLSEARAQLIVT
jgi:hypothetical protein